MDSDYVDSPSCVVPTHKVEIFAREHNSIELIWILDPSELMHDRTHYFQLRESPCAATIYNQPTVNQSLWAAAYTNQS